eukprot:350929-Chlamydomonas_euryale.AAC.1
MQWCPQALSGTGAGQKTPLLNAVSPISAFRDRRRSGDTAFECDVLPISAFRDMRKSEDTAFECNGGCHAPTANRHPTSRSVDTSALRSSQIQPGGIDPAELVCALR